MTVMVDTIVVSVERNNAVDITVVAINLSWLVNDLFHLTIDAPNFQMLDLNDLKINKMYGCDGKTMGR